jgi:membrane-bound ClpP family serine protease
MSGDTVVPPELRNALESYKTNYAAYRIYGNAGYKTAYENALKIANKFIVDSSKTINENDAYIQNFLSSYENSNSDITRLHKRSQRIQKEGPRLQDALAQSRQLHQREVKAVNDTYMYVKGAIVVGLLVIVGIVGAL